MNTDEEKRLALVIQYNTLLALQQCHENASSPKTATFASITKRSIDQSVTQMGKELEAMGTTGLASWDVPADLSQQLQELSDKVDEVKQVEEEIQQTEHAIEKELSDVAEAAHEAAQAPPPPPPIDPIAQQQQMQQQLLMADNVHNFPPKGCPRDGMAMNYSDSKGGYYCPMCDKVNPKASLLQRLTGGVTELSTAAVATTGAVAGASMGVMGATMAAQGNMAQMQNQMSAGAPPPIPVAGTGVKCPTCQQDATDMSAYGGAYAGKYYCNPCKAWVENSASGPAQPTVA